MTWKVAAGTAFLAVLVAEIIAMFVLKGLPLDMGSETAALMDGVTLAVCLFASNAALRRFVFRVPLGDKPGDWPGAAVLFVATVGFEVVIHPFSENISHVEGLPGVEIINALLTATAVGSLAGWMQVVEEQIAALGVAQSGWTGSVGKPMLIGAAISAFFLTATAGVRELNHDMNTSNGVQSAQVLELIEQQVDAGLQIGNVVLKQRKFGGQEQALAAALADGGRIGRELSGKTGAYLSRNRNALGRLAIVAPGGGLATAWQEVIDAATRFSRGDSTDQAVLSRDVHGALDAYVPTAVEAIEVLQTFERSKAELRVGGADNLLATLVVFLMAIGVLFPLLRLMGAQKKKLGLELRRAEKLNEKLSAYQHALDNHAIFAVTNRMGMITHVNGNFCRISGYSQEELLGQNHRLLNSGTHGPEFFSTLWASISAGKTWRYEVCNRSKDGGNYWVDTCIMPLVGADGRPEQFVSISYDITERKRTQIRAGRKAHLESLIDDMRQELFASGAMYSSMSGLLRELNVITGASASLVCEVGRTSEAQAWSLVLGHHRSAEAFTGDEGHNPVHLDDATAQPALVQEVFEQDGLFGGLTARQLGSQCFKGVAINVAYEPVGILLLSDNVNVDTFADEIQLVVSALGDMISARRESDRRRNEEEKARKQAKRDPLTGLGNRRDLAEQFDARTDHPDAKFALLLVDLDRFKPINDTYGHLIGDTVLRVVAERLRGCARGDTTVARIGGDEFALLTEVHATENEAGALALAQSILTELSQPIDCGGHSIQVGASVGVALFPRDGVAFQELLHRADAAMYRAKGNRSEAQVFNASMDEAIRYRGELEADLKRAIDAGEIKPHFQPYVDLRTGRVAGHEILARWRHPRRGFVSPAEFIKIAEESGLVDKLFWQFLRDACGQHLSRGLTTILSINLSPTQIKNPTFAKQLVDELDSLGFPPELLEVEITETSMIGDVERARPLLLLLRSRGIRIALDDFGTGYSSLALLRHMPINKVKIDRSFVIDVEGAEGAGLTIVNAILGIAKALKLQVTAEGIETVKVSEFLRDMGCDYGQGYLFGRAEPEPVTESLMADAHPRLSVVAGGRRT